MLNYPTLEQQLDQVGASLVLAQFAQVDSPNEVSEHF
jgi:hypothetical protein